MLMTIQHAGHNNVSLIHSFHPEVSQEMDKPTQAKIIQPRNPQEPPVVSEIQLSMERPQEDFSSLVAARPLPTDHFDSMNE